MPKLIAARSAVRSMLGLFEEHEIHVTWAVVGFLFAQNGKQLRDFLPKLRPQYTDRRLSPYLDLPPAEASETCESVLFAPSLIRQISRVANQEIGTHTLSHYYCLEPGNDAETFRADLMAAISVARRSGIEVRSLVFPKNQWRADFLKICAEAGIVSYRGTPDSWLYRPCPDGKKQQWPRRLGRLLDNYCPVSSGLSAALPLNGDELPIDVPASRFLRGYSPMLRAFEPLRLLRIKDEMTEAAKRGRLYHLWWHPHDFGANIQVNLRFLRRILDHYRTLRLAYGMESVNMGEAAAKSLFRREKSDSETLLMGSLAERTGHLRPRGSVGRRGLET
jgi:peptidoglycan/xylan/chitin deacetylase (PgdA/CDA1 family)